MDNFNDVLQQVAANDSEHHYSWLADQCQTTQPQPIWLAEQLFKNMEQCKSVQRKVDDWQPSSVKRKADDWQPSSVKRKVNDWQPSSVKRKVNDWQPSSVKNYQQLMINDEQSSSHNDASSSIQISSNLTVSVQKGDYGLYIRIQRKNRWMCLAESLWKIILANVQKLQTIGKVLHLTKIKRLEVINYMDKRDVSFVQQRLDSNFKSYINFNDSEWATLMEAIPAINTVLNDAMDCNVCQNLKRPIYVTKDNRMADTKLTKEQLEDIQEYNIGVQNQLGLTCTYCGVEGYMNDECHCHRYDCNICEPDNFCTKCHNMIVYSA